MATHIGTRVIAAVKSLDKKKTIAASTALLAVVFVGGSYWTGKSTERTFRDSMEEMANLGIKVTILDYKRGIFSATAHTEWVLPRSKEDQAALSFNHSIRHGPLLALASSARIHSELTLSNESTALLIDTFGSNPFGSKTPLTIKTTFGLFGGNHTRIISPKLDAATGEDQTRFSWGGLDGEISLNSDYSKIKAKIVIDGLSVSENVQDQPNQNQLQMGRVTFQTNMKKPREFERLFVGTSKLVLNKLSFRDIDKNTGAINNFVLENVRGETGTAITNGGLDIKVRFDADTLMVGDKSETTINKPEVTLQYENLDAYVLETIARTAQNQEQEQTREATILALQKQMGTLLRRKPAFSASLKAGLPEGATNGNFRIAYAGDATSQFSTNDLALDFQFSLPIAPISRLLEEQASRGAVEQAKAEKQVASINSLIDKGVLVEKDGFLNVDASLKSGALSLNGRTESLEVWRGLLQ
jgi:uncharacterized protein YdgA (DUF945 family)